MRRPHMSTGAWIFAGLIGAAIVAPVSVYAATVTNVRLLGAGSTTAAVVTPQHQLLTTQTDPKRVIHVNAGVPGPCKAVYTPPSGKGFVLTSVVYTYGSGIQGNEDFGGLSARSSKSSRSD